MKVTEIQKALIAAGYSVGASGADGIYGKATQRAVEAFQRARGLMVDGIAGPITQAALRPNGSAKSTGAVFIPWYDELMRRKGLHEVRNKIELSKFLKSDGAALGDPSKLPWCGDAIETVINLTLPNEAMVVNPYFARNWARFGVPCEPTKGCILVFSRGPKSGHVGLYSGEDKTHYYVLGGNQSNSISISRVAKSRLIASRWPKTVPLGAVDKGSIVAGAVITKDEA